MSVTSKIVGDIITKFQEASRVAAMQVANPPEPSNRNRDQKIVDKYDRVRLIVEGATVLNVVEKMQEMIDAGI